MSKQDFWLKDDLTSIARSLRLAVIQNQYRAGNISEVQARKLLSGPLTPGDNTTVFDDSDWLDVITENKAEND